PHLKTAGADAPFPFQTSLEASLKIRQWCPELDRVSLSGVHRQAQIITGIAAAGFATCYLEFSGWISRPWTSWSWLRSSAWLQRWSWLFRSVESFPLLRFSGTRGYSFAFPLTLYASSGSNRAMTRFSDEKYFRAAS
ncbi:MAG TPA: hypothetical protein VK846_05585, partial [Candidatus Limnocylindria bacterium]|nr:hypothetical protein [Candidatus Limnocylindria bacterium]